MSTMHADSREAAAAAVDMRLTTVQVGLLMIQIIFGCKPLPNVKLVVLYLNVSLCYEYFNSVSYSLL